MRAAVLGANDGIVSTASLLVGVAMAGASHDTVLLTGVAGLVAGAMSMAAGEYVSVSSQADAEEADLRIERASLRDNPRSERRELADIYERRGLSPQLANEVAAQLMARDALQAHARDEIGITEQGAARPVQAAVTSALAFSVGAALPLLAVWGAPLPRVPATVVVLSLVSLSCLGALAARAGGAPPVRAAARVTFWGGLAMALTALAGYWFGAAG